jgi:GDP-mannose 6-dehydrogenase
MRVSVFGLGYVGTVCAACLADQGHHVVGVDKSECKVDLISSGRSPIVERDIDGLVRRAVKAGRLNATLDASAAVASSEMSLVCVGTPSRSNGSLDLGAVETVVGEIGEAIRIKAEPHAVVVRSTVIPRMTREIIAPRIAAAASSNIALGFLRRVRGERTRVRILYLRPASRRSTRNPRISDSQALDRSLF